jgi:hypothetical protein
LDYNGIYKRTNKLLGELMLNFNKIKKAIVEMFTMSGEQLNTGHSRRKYATDKKKKRTTKKRVKK